MKRPLIVAHRGASAAAPENTLAAFRKGLEEGADGVEFDVRLTRDGVPVVFHDSTLSRVAGIDRRIADLNYKELADIDVGSWFDRMKQGATAPPASRDLGRSTFQDERIPTLAAGLELFENETGPVYVELKCDRPADIGPLVAAAGAVIQASNVPSGRIIVKSFELSALPLVRRMLPDVAAAALFAPKLARLFRPSGIVRTAARFEATHLSLHRSLVGRRIVDRAGQAGMPVTAWTVDNPAWLARRLDLGLFAVITNDPAGVALCRVGFGNKLPK
jgi:glycerophosphoryl diester phosphodiesterase